MQPVAENRDDEADGQREEEGDGGRARKEKAWCSLLPLHHEAGVTCWVVQIAAAPGIVSGLPFKFSAENVKLSSWTCSVGSCL